MAEAVSFGPEIILIAAAFLLVWVAAMVAYLVGGYVAVHRFAAGDRSRRTIAGTVLAALGGLYLVFVPIVNGEPWLFSLIPPAIHGVAAWRGHRRGGAPPPGPPPPPTGRPVLPPSPPTAPPPPPPR